MFRSILSNFLDSHLLFVCFFKPIQYLKELFLTSYYIHTTAYRGLLRKADAKIIHFIFTIQIFLKLFSKKYYQLNLHINTT